jgi:hypothetical protein
MTSRTSARRSGAPDPAELAATCEAAVTASRQLVEGGVAVAAPRTEPAVISPLGWTLSDISRTQLRHAVASEVDRVCTVRDTAFAEFGDLLDALTERPVGC